MCKKAKIFVPLLLYPQFLTSTSFAIYREEEIRNFFSHEIISTAGSGSQLILEARWGRIWRTNLWESTTIDSSQRNWTQSRYLGGTFVTTVCKSMLFLVIRIWVYQFWLRRIMIYETPHIDLGSNIGIWKIFNIQINLSKIVLSIDKRTAWHNMGDWQMCWKMTCHGWEFSVAEYWNSRVLATQLVRSSCPVPKPVSGLSPLFGNSSSLVGQGMLPVKYIDLKVLRCCYKTLSFPYHDT